MASRCWPYRGVGGGAGDRDHRVMPLRSRRFLSRAVVRLRVALRPTAVLLTVALSISSGSLTVEAAMGAARPEHLASVTDSSDASIMAERRWRIAGEIAAARTSSATNRIVAARASSGPSSITASRTTLAPIAVIEPLIVERGNLTLRWRTADGSGAAVASQAVRIEEAAATPTGCAAFSETGRISLGAGLLDYEALSLGLPASGRCLRVIVELTDRYGRSSLTLGTPYRIGPAATTALEVTTPAVKPWAGKFNLYEASAFVTQKTYRWCVAASVQMMVNLVRNHTDRTMATQATMIAYAQRWDNGPYGEDGGTDVTGWTTALRHFGAGNYRAVGATTAAKALRLAATAMRQTGRPAGILVMEGRHAWVLHGFESRTDPRRDRRAWITAVRISGPLYPLTQKSGYDPHPNTRLSIAKLERYFQPSIVGSLAGRYVVVIPTH
jgi:hypothetical protein